MKKNKLNIQAVAFVLVAAVGLSGLAGAEGLRQHEAHVHGEAAGNLTLDGGALRLELEIPGVNLVGFEHPPRDQQQRDRLDAVLADLRSGAWLSLDGRGRCELVSLDAHTHGFDENGHGEYAADADDHKYGDDHNNKRDHDHHHHQGHSSRHEHDHDHGPDHAPAPAHDHGGDHKHHHDDHGDRHQHDHAEFHLLGQWQCESPEGLRWLDLGLFENYPGNELVVLDVLTETLVQRFRLRPGNIRVSLVN